MIIVYPLKISKEQLDKAPEEERIFYLMAGQLANDIALLSKQLLFSLSSTSKGTGAERQVSTALALLTARILAGRLYEARSWLFGRESVATMKAIASRPNERAAKARRNIGAYFGKSNLIERLRNQVGFHFDPALAKSAYAKLSSEEDITEYLVKSTGDTFYFSGELLAIVTMMEAAGGGAPEEAMSRIGNEIPMVASWFQDVIGGVMKSFIRKYISPDWETVKQKALGIPGPPLLSVTIPFFCVAPTPAELAKHR